MILGENGEKMSKSRGNVVNPDDIVRDYGADTLRTYEMFIGAFDAAASWSEDGVKGCRRFLDRVWKLQDIMTDEEGFSKEFETKMHQTIKKVSFDYENLKYNTAIAQLMTMLNDFSKAGKITKGELKTYLIYLIRLLHTLQKRCGKQSARTEEYISRHGLNTMKLRQLSQRLR